MAVLVQVILNKYEQKYIKTRDSSIPKYAMAALDEGFEAVSEGMIVHAPMPSAINVPIFRLLFLGIEATYRFCFGQCVLMHKGTIE